MNIWTLPRPASFVEGIENAIRDGSNVVIRFPCSMPRGLEGELRGRLYPVYNAWTSIDASAASDPVVFLRERLCPDLAAHRARGMADLADVAAFQGRLLWIEKIGRCNWAQWAAALAAYADACRSVDLLDRTLFIVVLSGATVEESVPEEVALVRRDFRNVVDTLDLFVFALFRLSGRIEHPERRSLVAQTVSQVAQWDCQLAERLLVTPIEALSPDSALRDYARRQGWTPDTTRCWENGTVDGPANRPILHSAILTVSNDSASVSQRIWAGQSAVLLPLVEERRVAVIPRCRRYLQLPIETQPGEWVGDLRKIEIGSLAWHLERTNAPRGLKRQVHFLRRVRNKLAHMETLRPEDALNLCCYKRHE